MIIIFDHLLSCFKDYESLQKLPVLEKSSFFFDKMVLLLVQ